MNERCRHAGCNCEAGSEHGGFCSRECASAGTRAFSGACSCGHPGCQPQAPKRRES